MEKLIESMQGRFLKRRGVSRFITATQLFCLFFISAFQRAIALLFQSPQKSFLVFHRQDGRGIWNGSFSQHQVWKSKVRVFSWSSLTILVVASVVSFASTQLLFPGNTDQALAATSTFTVSNTNDSGAGSFRQALTDCNAVGGGNDCIIELANAADLQTLAPTSTLPTLTKPAVFSNLGSDTDFIINGSSLSDSCLYIGAGAEGTVIEGIGFHACPDSAIVIDAAASNIQIGTTSSDSDRVYISSGDQGISVGGDNITIQNVVFGTGATNIFLGQATTAIEASSAADNLTITGALIERASTGGIALSSTTNVTISDSTIQSNSGYGLSVSDVTTATFSENTIQSNASCGVIISGGSAHTYTTNTISGNTSHGVCVSGSPSNMRLGGTSAATVGSQGNSIIGSSGSSAIFMGLATPSGFNVGYNATLSAIAPVIGYQSGGEPFAEASNLVATPTEIRGTAAVSSGYVAAYQNGSFIGSTVLSGADFTISGPNLVGSLSEGATIRVVTLNSSNNPSIMSSSVTVSVEEEEEDEEGGGVDIGVTPSSTSARFTTNSGDRSVRLNVYVATTPEALATDVPDSGPYGFDHDITVSNLSPETVYYWKVTADADDDSFTGVELDSGTFTTTAAPEEEVPGEEEEEDGTPETVAVTVDPEKNSAVLSFTTTQSVTPKVYVSRTQPDILNTTPTIGSLGTTHAVTVTGLTASTRYYYTVTGTAGDSSFTDATLATGSFTTDASELDDDFLSENATLNDQVVYDSSQKLYLGPDEVNLELENTTKDSDVFFEITEKETSDVVLSTDWQSITKQVITKAFSNLEQGVEYILKGTLRSTEDTTQQDSAKTISKFEKTDRTAPAFATYSGNVTVTAVPTVKMGGNLSGLAGEVILQDIVTGATAASCDIPKGDSLCTLEPYPAPGDYRIQFRSVKGQVPSAPDQTLFTIASATPTSTLFVDRANPNFMNRIVLNDSVKVVGNAVKSADVEIYLNGEKVKTINHQKDKTTAWEYTLSLKGKAKKSYILRVIYRDRASDKFVKTFTMPFVYASPVADLVVQNVQNSYITGSAANARIIGGRGDVVSIYVDGAFVVNRELEQVGDTALGKTDISLPTTTGAHTLELSARNSVGLRGNTVRRTYSAARPQPVAVAAVEESSNQNAVVEEEGQEEGNNSPQPTTPVVDENEPTVNNTNTENPTTPTNESPAPNVNAGEIPTTGSVNGSASPEIQSPVAIEDLPVAAQALIKNDITTAGLIIIDESVLDTASLPQQYAQKASTPAEIQAVRQAMDKALEIKTEIDFVKIQTDAAGKESNTPLALDQGEIPVFTHQKNIGLPGFGEQATKENYGIQLSGSAVPYALVKVTVRSTPIVKMTRADENGKWTMTVPVDTLEPGKHTASLQTESQGVVSDSIEIANFVIVEDQKISNTTWVVIVNVFIAVLILILVLGIQLGRKKPQTATPQSTPSMHRQPSAGQSNDTDVSGGALGV